MTIIKKFEPEETKSRLPKKYGVLAVLILFMLTVVEIWASNTVVTYGARFESLSKLSKGLLIENQVLENEIAKYTSLSNTALKSAQLGFFKTDNIQYIR